MKDEAITVIGMVVLALAPMWLLASDRGSDEVVKTVAGSAAVGVGLAMKTLCERLSHKNRNR